MDSIEGAKNRTLTPYVSAPAAWALALGTSIGWGSLIVTSNTYLVQAGPAGSIAGLLIGAVIMIVIARNYHYMLNCFPDSGGAYTYAKEAFGYDQGFLAAWFLALTYGAMLWANATALPLFARFFLGEIFEFGFHYNILGYDVYMGEAMLSMAAICLIALLCMKCKRASVVIMTVLVVILTAGITICFAGAAAGHGEPSFSMQPAFIPDKGHLSQIIRIAFISPWAFIGFENISHSAAEFTFSREKTFRILTLAVISAAALYVFVLLLSVSAYPPEYSSWMDYIRDLNNLKGIKGLPAFYAAYCYLGERGVFILIVALLGLIITSLIGSTLALSRLLYAMARDNILPKPFSRLGRDNVPEASVMLVAAVSLLIPFFGRTAVGWIVDVTTIGATLIYGFVSASAMRIAKKRNDKAEHMTGAIGTAVMIVFGVFLLLPNLFSSGAMTKESYILFTVWAILGFLFFRRVLRKDTARKFGQTVIVWFALLSLTLFTSLAWMSESTLDSAGQTVSEVRSYYTEQDSDRTQEEQFITEKMSDLKNSNMRSMIIVVGLFAISLSILINNYVLITHRAKESEEKANTDPLTGVKSKHAFLIHEQELDQKIQSESGIEFAIVICDVNGLKHLNDTMGHKAGDAYIREACTLVCECFQHSPVFRIGGDEFVITLT